MKNLRFGFGLALAVLLALAFSSPASAQATRTWVSGVGDDANPCSRTAPCKTWAGAISKTAAGGEIDALDPGGFGALTITKSITVDGGGGQVASVLVAGTNGIVIAAASNDVVTLRNLQFDGLLGNGANAGNAGLDGVKILAAGSVHLEHLVIFGFNQNGVEVAASAAISLSINDCTITDATLAGVLVASTSGIAKADINNLRAYNTHPGVAGGGNSFITVSNSVLSFGGTGAKPSAAGSTINVINSQLNANYGYGLEGLPGSTINASGNTISANVRMGVNTNGGNIFSDGTNLLLGNDVNGSFSPGGISKF